ncbi:MAG: MFS transporter [Janthinobacterium lividum]
MDDAVVRQDELAGGQVATLGVLTAVAVANGYYVQPLLNEVGAAIALPPSLLGLLPACTQLGFAIGLVAVLPLSDGLTARRVLLAVVPLQIAALLFVAASRGAAMLMIGCLAIGVTGMTPYILPPYASLRVPPGRLGYVTGMLTRGVNCGILLARAAAGVVAVHLGWRAVYVMAAVAMMGVLAGLARIVTPQPRSARIGYGRLIASMARLLRSEPKLRTAALCQGFNFGSFNTFWLSSTLYLHDLFGWSPDQIGTVGILGAVAAFSAPLFGRAITRVGPARARTVALAGIVLSWVLFAALRDSLAGMAVALILIDICATVQDISSRTILYALAPDQRTRLNAVYTLAMFAGGGASSALVGLCWVAGGWLAVCALGAASAVAGLAIAARAVRLHPSCATRR